MIAYVDIHIRSVRLDMDSLEGQLNHVLPSRLSISSRDKDMSDYKAIKQTIRFFWWWNSPGRTGQLPTRQEGICPILQIKVAATVLAGIAG